MKKTFQFVRAYFGEILIVLAFTLFGGFAGGSFAPQSKFWFGASCVSTISWTWLAIFLHKASKEPVEMHANAPAGTAILQLMVIGCSWMAVVSIIATIIRAYNLFF